MISKAGIPWILGGVAVGTAVGLLFAPQSGKVTRSAMKHKLLQLREKYQAAHMDRAAHRDRQESASR